MKFLAFLILTLVCAAQIQAKTTVSSNGKGRKLGTNFNFEDMMVRGKYQYPDEAITSVEDEKALNDLLGVRKHFKDKLQSASLRH